jgi:hypothetical protein
MVTRGGLGRKFASTFGVPAHTLVIPLNVNTSSSISINIETAPTPANEDASTETRTFPGDVETVSTVNDCEKEENPSKWLIISKKINFFIGYNFNFSC